MQKFQNNKPEVASELPDPEKILILVGFGKKDLSELVEMVQNGKESEVMKAISNVPPRWRRMKICDDKDIENMKIFTEFLAEKMANKLPGL